MIYDSLCFVCASQLTLSQPASPPYRYYCVCVLCERVNRVGGWPATGRAGALGRVVLAHWARSCWRIGPGRVGASGQIVLAHRVGSCWRTGSGRVGASGQVVLAHWAASCWRVGSGRAGALGQAVLAHWAGTCWRIGSGRVGALGQVVLAHLVRPESLVHGQKFPTFPLGLPRVTEVLP